MSARGELHDLLPWFMTGTLDPGEAAAFRTHLESCDVCRDEMTFLKQVQGELERHGAALLEDHPPAERLVAAVRGDLPNEESVAVMRHVALCPACATEAAWVRGERVAGTPETKAQRPPASRQPWLWLGAAAAAVLLAVLFLPRPGPDTRTGIVQPVFVRPTELAAAEPSVVELGPDDPAVLLLFEVDLPESSFPIELEINGEDGRTVHRQSGIERAALLQDLYLAFECDRRECPPGSYTVQLSGSNGASPVLRHRFRILAR